ncbi:metal-dependent hydrolase [archaeon]|jgi:inner membrane protein|nr:metal-dependent hydrolase [archaeon]MBT5492702.1 metal-dependent hydrolase [bacterium]
MTWKTHAAFGLTAISAPSFIALKNKPELYGDFLALNSNVIDKFHGEPIFFIFTLMFFSWLGSFVPDLDHEGSYISKRLKLISFFTKYLKHRGSTHSFIVAGLVSFILYFSFMYFELFGLREETYIYFLAFWFGWASHLLSDMLTTSGLKHMFFPLFSTEKGKTIIPKIFTINTNSAQEFAIYLFPLICFNIFFVFYLIDIK